MATILFASKSIELETRKSCKKQLRLCRKNLTRKEKRGGIIKIIDGDSHQNSINDENIQKIMSMVRQGQISKVCIYNVRTLATSVQEFVEFIELLNEHHVTLISVSEKFDSSDEYCKLIVKIIKVFPVYEKNSNNVHSSLVN